MKSELRARLEKIAPYKVNLESPIEHVFNHGIHGMIEAIMKDAKVMHEAAFRDEPAQTYIAFDFQPVEIDTMEKLVSDLANPKEGMHINYYIERARKLLGVYNERDSRAIKKKDV